MKFLSLVLFCLLTFACSQAERSNIQLTTSKADNTNTTPIQVLKEEQLINLLSNKIVDSIGGQTEDAENLIAIENLIKQGVDVNTRDKSTYQTPLMLAVQHGRPSALRMLLNANADVNLQDSRGDTALMGAANAGDLTMVKLLLEHGAKTGIENNGGYTALTASEYVNGTDGLEPKEKYVYLEIRRLLKGRK